MDKLLILIFFIGAASGVVYFAGWLVFLISIIVTTL